MLVEMSVGARKRHEANFRSVAEGGFDRKWINALEK